MANTPFFLKPSGKDYLWGGQRLNTIFNKNIPLSPLAESWECSIHPDGPSYLPSGETLRDFLASHPEALGEKLKGQELPILVKFIDALQDLSIQVHPDDTYASERENGQKGKTEMWYVVDAEPGAKLVYGLKKELSKEEFRAAIEQSTLEEHLNSVDVRKGDVFFINAGTIHAIGAGALIAEIQQNSNLTYRIYDFGRRGKDGKLRELHVDKALDVSDLSVPAKYCEQPVILQQSEGLQESVIGKCEYFEVRKVVLSGGKYTLPSFSESFRHVLSVSGVAKVTSADLNAEIKAGESLFIPASSAEVSFEGEAELLVSMA